MRNIHILSQGKCYFLLAMVVIIVGCSSSRDIETTLVSNEIQVLILQKKFIIDSDMAYPLVSSGLQSLSNTNLIPLGSTVNQFNLIGNSNYFKVIGDSISVYLPYFGEQRMGGLPYNNTNVGIAYEGIPNLYDLSGVDKRGMPLLQFSFRNGIESYKVRIQVYPKGKAIIMINSSHRTPIRYSGIIKAVEIEKEGVASN